MATTHLHTIDVFYEDTDAGGIVYYANYLKFMERARTKLLACLGINQRTLAQQQNILFVVKSCDLNLIKPAYLDDTLIVKTSIQSLGRAQVVFKHKIYQYHRHLYNDTNLICQGIAQIVCVKGQTLKPTAIPNNLHKDLAFFT